MKMKISNELKKYHITTFGCQTNVADSERIASALESGRLKKSAKREDADVLILNTCSIRQKAEDRVFGLKREIDKLKTKNCRLKTVLTGCMMHYDKKELARRLPFMDIFIDIKDICKLPKLLGLKKSGQKRLKKDYLNLEPKYISKISAGVPISYGCDNFCAYCIVPYSRNREYSRPVEDIVKEVQNLVEKGYKEIWLLGQNVNSYRRGVDAGCKKPCLRASRVGCGTQFITNKGVRSGGKVFCEAGTGSFEIKFPELLRIINSIPGDFWIRFTSPHPKDFSDDLIEAMAECEKFAHYINLPLQSGDNAILKKMNRPYTAGHYKKLVAKIRKAIPDIALSTDIIVGFPGETKKRFENTAKLMREVGFEMAYLSEYSPRPGTAAAKTMKDDVPHKEKERRKEILNNILKKSALKINKKFVGKILRVLNGKTAGHKSVKISGKAPKDKFIRVKITGAGAWGLEGEIEPPKKIIVVLGPTASGKSDLAVELAREFGGEVISADSRQVYKKMDIGTGKITKKEMRGVPHHLLDVANPKNAFTVIDFKKKAEKALEDIWSRGKTPIICGGTGFYIQAITGGVVIPEVKPDLKLRAKLAKKSAEQLFKTLQKLDPERAKTIDRKNPRRLIRAIEIATALGSVPKPAKFTWELNSQVDNEADGRRILYIGVKLPEKKLKEKVEKRMKQMLKAGLVKETEKLKKMGLSWKRVNELGFEYKYPAMYLRGEISKDELLERLVQSNLKYAKRQMTWFKKYAPEAKWINPSAGGFTKAKHLAQKFL